MDQIQEQPRRGVANPSIQAELHVSLAGIQWVTNGYLLAIAVSLITVGRPVPDRPDLQPGDTVAWFALLALTADRLTAVESAASVGLAPVIRGTPAPVAPAAATVARAAFVSGMTAGFRLGAVVARAGAAVAVLAKGGHLVTSGSSRVFTRRT